MPGGFRRSAVEYRHTECESSWGDLLFAASLPNHGRLPTLELWADPPALLTLGQAEAYEQMRLATKLIDSSVHPERTYSRYTDEVGSPLRCRKRPQPVPLPHRLWCSRSVIPAVVAPPGLRH